MKKRILKIATIATAAVALVVVTVLVTVAYLTSSSAVTNVFTIGNVGVLMYESKVNQDGEVIESGETNAYGGNKTADTNSYHLVPGRTYVKDPTIYMAPGSDPAFVFVKVRNDIAPIEKGNYVHTDETNNVDANSSTIEQQIAANGWAEYAKTTSGTIYVYTGKAGEENIKQNAVAVKASEKPSIDVFGSFTVDEHAEIANYGGAKVLVTAYAVQLFQNDQETGKLAVDLAWNAIVATYPYESGTAVNE